MFLMLIFILQAQFYVDQLLPSQMLKTNVLANLASRSVLRRKPHFRKGLLVVIGQLDTTITMASPCTTSMATVVKQSSIFILERLTIYQKIRDGLSTRNSGWYLIPQLSYSTAQRMTLYAPKLWGLTGIQVKQEIQEILL